MKTKITLFLVLFISALCIAQNGINYKALIKDNNGNVISNSSIDIYFKILDETIENGESTFNVVYEEGHATMTDNNGLAIVNIGQGSVFSEEDFESIKWGTSNHYLNVAIDIGTGATDLGTTQFMTVPYALSAGNVSGLEAIDEGNGIGWRLKGSNPDFFDTIGENAVDLSYSIQNETGNGATGQGSLAFGNTATASSSGAIALGDVTTASAINSLATGLATTASGDYSATFGVNSVASGDASFASGFQSLASGSYATALGNFTIASGLYSTATGTGTTASGDNSTAIGTTTTALGQSSTAIGFFTNANGSYTSSLGIFTNADAYASTAIGSGNIGGGDPNTWIETDPLFEIGNNKDVPDASLNQNALTVLKNGTITAPSLDISEITNDKALITREYYFSRLSNGSSGLERVNEGNGFGWKLKFQPTSLHGDIGQSSIDLTTQASGFVGGATGDFATGIGLLSHAQGDYSTSLGWLNKSIGFASMALGDHTTTTAYGSTAVGSYNVGGGNPNSPVTTDPLFEVGNGTLSEPSNAITVLKNGNVGLGSITSPEAQLHLDGNIGISNARLSGFFSGDFIIGTAEATSKVGYFDSFNEWGPSDSNTISLGSTGFRWTEIWSVNPLNTSSDRRLKKNISPINYGLETVMNLKPVSYKWKQGKQDTKLGFIAQDVLSIVPEIVKQEKISADKKVQLKKSGREVPKEDYYAISYIELIPVLVKAVQELKTENVNLKKRIEQLENN